MYLYLLLHCWSHGYVARPSCCPTPCATRSLFCRPHTSGLARRRAAAAPSCPLTRCSHVDPLLADRRTITGGGVGLFCQKPTTNLTVDVDCCSLYRPRAVRRNFGGSGAQERGSRIHTVWVAGSQLATLPRTHQHVAPASVTFWIYVLVHQTSITVHQFHGDASTSITVF